MANEEVNKALEAEIQIIREQANALLSEAEVLERLLTRRRGQNVESMLQNIIPTVPINAYSDYFRGRTNKEKSIAILKGTGRFIHKIEFIDIVKAIDPKITEDELSQLISALYTLKAEGRITNVKVNDKRQLTFWGAISWMDSGGIKPEFTFREDVLDSLEGGKMTI